jgi:hypothetical protein
MTLVFKTKNFEVTSRQHRIKFHSICNMHRCIILLTLLFVSYICGQQFDEFYKWCDEKEIEYNKIQIKHSENFGNGIYASEDIKVQ